MRIKKKKFPIGIFLLLWILLSLIATGGAGAYFYFTVKSMIADFEHYSKKYSITLANAFSNVAELSYQTGNYRNARRLFTSKLEDNTIDMAFFVLKDGSVVAHSSRREKKRLKGNIFNQEFEYNADLILAPAIKGSRKVSFTYYNIMNKKIPRFDIPVITHREQIKYIKKYFYKDYDRVGWLAAKAVYHKKKAVGVVAFIISKDKVYNYMVSQFTKVKSLLVYLNSGAFGLSFIISLIILLRYRSIQNKMLRYSHKEIGNYTVDTEYPVPEQTQPVKDKERDKQKEKQKKYRDKSDNDEEYVSVELFDDQKNSQSASRKRRKIIVPIIYEEDVLLDEESEIQDSIPANREG